MKRGPYKNSIAFQLREMPEDFVREIIQTSKSVRECCLRLNLKMSGSMYGTIREYAESKQIELIHFLGQAANSGKLHRGGKIAKSPDQVLTLKNRKQGTQSIRRALLQIGRPYVCEICKLLPEWNGKKLVIQIDHKDGNRLDDRAKNLRFLCPNCHSQTDTFTSKNMKIRKKV